MDLSLLTRLVDQYCLAREDRLAADKTAANLKAVESELQARVTQEMINHSCDMVGGTYKKVTRKSLTKPKVGDWEEVYKFMMENDAPDLLQRRLNEGAVAARVEDGINVPGVEYIEVNKLTVSKL